MIIQHTGFRVCVRILPKAEQGEGALALPYRVFAYHRHPTVLASCNAHHPVSLLAHASLAAPPRLRAVSRDDAGVLARVTEMMAKHRAAKAAVARIILAVSRYPGRDPATREGGAGVRGRGGSAVAVAVAEPNIRAGTGASAAAAVEPLEMDNSAASMEEGRPLL